MPSRVHLHRTVSPKGEGSLIVRSAKRMARDSYHDRGTMVKRVDRRLVWGAAALVVSGLLALRITTREKAGPVPIEQQLEEVRNRASAALASTPFPAGAAPIDSTIVLRPDGTTVQLTYLAVTAVSADDQALVEHHASAELGLSPRSVELRWIPQQMQIGFDPKSGSLTETAHQQLVALSHRIAEHRDLEVIVLPPDDSARSAVLLANVRAVMSGAGMDEARIWTTKGDAARPNATTTTITISVRRVPRT